MSLNLHEVEIKAAALSFTMERGVERSASYYIVKDSDGMIVLGEGFTASLKKIDTLLDSHVKGKAEAIGLRLEAKKIIDSFDEPSSSEAATRCLNGSTRHSRNAPTRQLLGNDRVGGRLDRIDTGIVDDVTR